MTEPTKILVVGGDAAGMSAAHQALRTARDRDRAVEVTVLEATGHTSYSACGIPYWIAGEVPSGDDLVARSAEEHRAKGVDLRLGAYASGLDLGRREVTYEADGASHTASYDELVLATGAAPHLPDWARAEDGGLIPGVLTVKNLDDGAQWIDLIAAQMQGTQTQGTQTQKTVGRRAVIAGGGYIGVEMAEALVQRGYRTSLVTRSRVMSSLDEELTPRIAAALAEAGVEVHTGSTLTGVSSAQGRVSGVQTSTGEELPADVVVLAIGVAPVTELGAQAGLELGRRGGYLPDAGGRVAPGVWAAGDCCEVMHRITGERTFLALGTHANKLGRVVGANLLGESQEFGGALGTAITRFVSGPEAGGVHLEMARTGLSEAPARAAGYDVIALVTESTTASGYMPEAAPMATKVIADRATRALLGVQIVGGSGAGKRVDAAAAALWGRLTVDDLAGMDLSYAPPFATVWDAVQIAARRLAERM